MNSVLISDKFLRSKKYIAMESKSRIASTLYCMIPFFSYAKCNSFAYKIIHCFTNQLFISSLE